MLKGFRFHKSFKILPGIRLNLSKSGLSTSIGKAGRTINIGPKGNRATVGLPGTGLSYRRSFGAGYWLYWIITIAVLFYAAWQFFSAK